MVGNCLLANAEFQRAGSLGSQDCILGNNKQTCHSVQGILLDGINQGSVSFDLYDQAAE